MNGTYRDRRITHNGRPATVLQDYWDNDTFEFAVIRYLDKNATGPAIHVIRGLETVEKGLLPIEEEKQTEEKPPAEETSQEEETGGSETPETPSVAKRTAKNIALPEYGPTDSHYVLSPTGKWIPRQTARKETDVALSAWIDVDYPPRSVWPVEYIADDRVNTEGKHEFLIKFLGYELNPGVEGDPSNYGDWYSKEENVDPADIREYRKKKARRSI